MTNKAVIGNVVLGLGVIGLGALVIAERGVTDAKNAAEPQPAAIASAEPGPLTPAPAVVPVPEPVPETPVAPAPTVAAAPPATSTSTTPTPSEPQASAPMAAMAKPETVREVVAAAPPTTPVAVDPDGDEPMTCEAPPPADVARRVILEAIPATKVNTHVVQPGDTISRLARANKISAGLIRRVNGLATDVIRVGQKLVLPKGPFRAVVDRGGFSVGIYLDDTLVRKYPVGIGRGGSTPDGEFEVRSRVEDPEWTSPEGDYFRSGDPENPLGNRWLGFGDGGYGIHGTTEPGSIGKEASRGCVRLNNDDVLEVYDFLTLGSKVVIK